MKSEPSPPDRHGKQQRIKRRSDLVAWLAFATSCLALAYALGAATVHWNVFPYPAIRSAWKDMQYDAVRLPWWQFRYDRETPAEVHDAAAMMPGLTLVSGFSAGDEHLIRIVDSRGTELHRWVVDPARIWPETPEIAQGEHVHGVALMENGDLVLNYSENAMIRLSGCSNILWRLDKPSHHTIDIAADGTIWAPGQIGHGTADPRLPNHKPWFLEATVLQVDPDGKVKREISVNELFLRNGLAGLLYMSTTANDNTIVRGDTLHLNDVEIFPETLEEGLFRHGDVMLSLRNINTVLVFDPETLGIRWISTGRFLRQHDPDFIDGNTVSVFDNNNLLDTWFDNASGTRASQGIRSRIVTLSATDDRIVSVHNGGPDNLFFTEIMGEHQRLANGNLLITETRAGRIFEITSDGRLIWEYFNLIGPDLLGAIDGARRLSAHVDAGFVQDIAAGCSATGTD